MAKAKTIFFCQECGYESGKWMGQCPSCKTWNSFVEEPVVKKNGAAVIQRQNGDALPKRLSEITFKENERIHTNIHELDRVLGGGIVHGSLVLVGGDPGIGKSTLLLQMFRALSEKDLSLLYISGEIGRAHV